MNTNTRFTHNGLTLVELMVTITVATILIGIAAPSLSSLYDAQRAGANIRKIQQSLQFARNAAISYGVRVTVCPVADNQCNSDWQSGLVIFTDSGTTNILDGSDKVIYQTGEFHQQDTISYNRRAVHFYPDGLASGSNGTLKYCPGSPTSSSSKAVIVNQAGRVRFSTDNNISCSP
ncbi:GspH/FimT family pseudopilin [Shewanella sp. Isolate11]|uniref:GspH/FimT family pseudopilin n=1 Tax=Shewanella sp. Isolate11 TaxID=2908530 RepID=UPI001EFC82E4|nr:GspH/FimT family pseudopilin [Shewanella sp. Isolate11]MCG9695997.1 GspH/FimT family pseudopilin [Shewanella sp. Isolate11]